VTSGPALAHPLRVNPVLPQGHRARVARLPASKPRGLTLTLLTLGATVMTRSDNRYGHSTLRPMRIRVQVCNFWVQPSIAEREQLA
jgi:hypothetical protein